MIEITLASALITTILLLLLSQRQLQRQIVRPPIAVRAHGQRRIHTGYEEEEEEDEGDWAIGAHRLVTTERQPGSQIAGHDYGNNMVEAQEEDLDGDIIAEDPSASLQNTGTRCLLPSLRIAIPDSDTTAEVPLDPQETSQGNSQNLGQQRALRVRFDEALRMHSFGGSQYVGRVVDREDTVLKSPAEEKGEDCGVDKRGA